MQSVGTDDGGMPAVGPAAESERMVLARHARAAALGVPGVVDTTSVGPPAIVTVDGLARVEGVSCLAAPGGYDLALALICEMVPLPALGAAVEAAVREAAAADGIPVGEVNVHVAGLVGAGA